MGWSGRASAPPAIEAGKGRQRRGARHVTQAQFCNRRDRHALARAISLRSTCASDRKTKSSKLSVLRTETQKAKNSVRDALKERLNEIGDIDFVARRKVFLF
jgi:hypothetical protein